MRQVRWGVLCAAFAFQASAAEPDIFDIDSFIDPRDLGAQMKVGGQTTPGATYQLYGLSAGTIGQYQDRSTFTDGQREFADLTYNRYWSAYQLTADVAVLNNEQQSTTYRAMVGFGGYTLDSAKEKSADPFVSRWLVTATVDNRLGLGTQYEIDASMLVEVPLEKFHPRGGLSVSYRGGEGVSQTQILWRSSDDIVTFAHGAGRINVALWFGAERANDTTRPLPVNGEVLVEYRFARKTEVHFGYSPAYAFKGTANPKLVNNEWMVSLYRSFGSKLSE